jgi:hypothetical protein
MTLDQLVNFIVEIAESEPADALSVVERYVELYLAENRYLPPYISLKNIFFEFQRKSHHIHNRLSMQILEKLAERIPVGY